MIFIVVSDIHGRSDLLSEVLRTHRRADGVLFLGDGIRDISYAECTEGGRFFSGVRGNCDFSLFFRGEYDFSEELLLTLSEYNVIMMHGHTLGVKSGIERAMIYASERGADVLLFGHTHTPIEKYYPEGTEIDGYRLKKPLWVFNPGSLGCSADGKHTYGLMQIKNGQLLFSHGEIK